MRFLLLATVCLCCSGCYLDRVYRCDDCTGGVGYSGRLASLVTDNRCDQCTGQARPCRDCLQYTLTARTKHMATCGSGCSDVYLDEWLSDPPAACDPCDNHGRWTGQPDPCCDSKWGVFWANFWGTRLERDCCGGQGCASCQSTGEVWQETTHAPKSGKPTPAKRGQRTVRPGPAK